MRHDTFQELTAELTALTERLANADAVSAGQVLTEIAHTARHLAEYAYRESLEQSFSAIRASWAEYHSWPRRTTVEPTAAVEPAQAPADDGRPATAYGIEMLTFARNEAEKLLQKAGAKRAVKPAKATGGRKRALDVAAWAGMFASGLIGAGKRLGVSPRAIRRYIDGAPIPSKHRDAIRYDLRRGRPAAV